jgi:hypothetical protein
MFDAVGMPVRRLVRVRVGTLKLTDLAAGQARRLTHHEVSLLASCARAENGTRVEKRSRPKASPPAAGSAARPSELQSE